MGAATPPVLAAAVAGASAVRLHELQLDRGATEPPGMTAGAGGLPTPPVVATGVLIGVGFAPPQQSVPAMGQP